MGRITRTTLAPIIAIVMEGMEEEEEEVVVVVVKGKEVGMGVGVERMGVGKEEGIV
jgi:hypothetical protein